MYVIYTTKQYYRTAQKAKLLIEIYRWPPIEKDRSTSELAVSLIFYDDSRWIFDHLRGGVVPAALVNLWTSQVYFGRHGNFYTLVGNHRQHAKLLLHYMAQIMYRNELKLNMWIFRDWKWIVPKKIGLVCQQLLLAEQFQVLSYISLFGLQFTFTTHDYIWW